MRRYTGNMNGERYLANTSPSKRKVHDLDNETSRCLIDEIIAVGNDRPYTSLAAAKADGFDTATTAWAARFDDVLSGVAVSVLSTDAIDPNPPMRRKPSWKKALGITKARRDFARKTGVPTTRSGAKRKLTSMVS